MRNRTAKKIDLDAFIEAASETKTTLKKMEVPSSDKISVVGILADDSGSIKDANLRQDVVNGVHACLDALKEAKGAEFYISIQGFKQNYYEGLLKNYTYSFTETYDPDHRDTPLVNIAHKHHLKLLDKASQYTNSGIPCTVSHLLITDGMPKGDIDPSYFASILKRQDYVVGIGVCASESEIRYVKMFQSMGINQILTPQATGSEIRRAIHEFSRSVASAALR